MAGRPPKPTKLKLLEGTFRPDRARPDEPQPNRSDTRYLEPDNRDFFAVYTRLSGPVTVPFK